MPNTRAQATRTPCLMPRRHNPRPAIVAFAAVAYFGFVCAGCTEPGPRESACQNRFLVQTSPKKTYEATLYNYAKGGGSGFLGGTVSRPLYVNVRRRDQPFDPEKGQVFEMRHGYRVRFVWRDENHLLIEYPNDADVERNAPRIGDVYITYQPAPLPGGVSDAERASAQPQTARTTAP